MKRLSSGILSNSNMAECANWRQAIATDLTLNKALITLVRGIFQPVYRDELWKQYESLHPFKDSINNK